MQRRGDTADWVARINAWKAQYPLHYQADDRLRPQYIIEELSRLLDGEGVIASEVGQNQMWTALYYCFKKPRTWITSGGLGTMGYGFPAAIGAHFARPDLPVVDIAGDGSFQMNIQELGTVAHYRIPVKVVILNNMYLGMVRQWQELFYDRRYSYTELPPVEFVRIVRPTVSRASRSMRRMMSGKPSRPPLRPTAVRPRLQDRAGGERLPMVPRGCDQRDDRGDRE